MTAALIGAKARGLQLSRGNVAIVDAHDYDDLSRFVWYSNPRKHTTYAERTVRGSDGRRGTARLHRVITRAPAGMVVDHINGNGLDNRRSNLRVVTHAENLRNRRGPTSRNTSGFLGVWWDSRSGKWRAEVQVDGRRWKIGSFGDPVEAAIARDGEALKLYGEFATLNFPELVA